LREHAHQVTEVEAFADDYSLHLVELGEVLVVEALVAVDLRHAEDPRLGPPRVSCSLYRYRGVVRPQHEAARLFHVPLVAPPLAPAPPPRLVGGGPVLAPPR